MTIKSVLTPERLRDLDLDCAYQVPLSSWTTFRLGGVCPCLIHCSTPDQLEVLIPRLSVEKIPFILIGEGSNLLISDHGVSCAVVRYVSPQPIIRHEGNIVEASGSTSLDALVLFAARQGLKGLNYATGIPGTVGGAIAGNAGAFGQQIGDATQEVVLLTPDGEKKTVCADQLDFSYRSSRIKKTREIVAAARFHLEPENVDQLMKEREEIFLFRKERHPDPRQFPCAGSFFRNIEPTSKAQRRQAAGWFLEQAGAKGLSIGGARVFEKHANIIVNNGNCTAQQVFDLSQKMRALVYHAFGLSLTREVQCVGSFCGHSVVESSIWIW
jgi:UDP-N-acetylmuramate dehydrogenase